MKYITIIFCCLLIAWRVNAQKAYPVWPPLAPGIENRTWDEQTDTTELVNDPLVYNVVRPTVTYYPADPATANSTAVIICPGGSFCYLHIETEGSDVAKWLNKKGVAAFVLKYRLVHSLTDHPKKEQNYRMRDTANAAKLGAAIIPLSIADARQAIIYVRRHAGQFSIAQNKIGIIGFSAGGTLAAASAFNYTAEDRPDFVAAIYPYAPASVLSVVQKDTPPIFIAAASDDELHLVPMSIDLYDKWLAAGRDAELHIYSKGGHGFGMNRQHQPSDTWIERFSDWLNIQGLLKVQVVQ